MAIYGIQQETDVGMSISDVSEKTRNSSSGICIQYIILQRSISVKYDAHIMV